MKKPISLRLPILLTLSLAVAAALGFSAPASAIAACTPGAADKPDLGIVDSNCDGIDGDKAAAIFVAPGGSDANDGSFGHPMATVTAAVVAGLAAHKDVDVDVAAGTYGGEGPEAAPNGKRGVGNPNPAVGDFDGDGLNDEIDACPIVAGAGNGCPSTAAGPPAAPATPRHRASQRSATCRT